MVCSESVTEETVGFFHETYRFQTLDCVLTDVHAPGLFHLHVAQVLKGGRGDKDRGKTESCCGTPADIPKESEE